MKKFKDIITEGFNSKLDVGQKIPYWDKNGKMKTGKITKKPESGRGTLTVDGNIELDWSEFESFWKSSDVPGAARDPKGYDEFVDSVYKTAGGSAKAQRKDLSPFK